MTNDTDDTSSLGNGFQVLPLTDDSYQQVYEDLHDDSTDSTPCTWVDDCECQENLFMILPLMPEESGVDDDNHVYSTQGPKVFFPELGYFSEEPASIDPTRDYEQESKEAIAHFDRMRRKHVDLGTGSTPSLEEPTSGYSSASSSFHHTDLAMDDARSPHYIGTLGSQHVHHHSHHPHPPHHPHHPHYPHHPHHPHHPQPPVSLHRSKPVSTYSYAVSHAHGPGAAAAASHAPYARTLRHH